MFHWYVGSRECRMLLLLPTPPGERWSSLERVRGLLQGALQNPRPAEGRLRVCVCVEGNKMKSTNSTKPKSDGLQPKSDDLQSKSDGLRPKEGMRSTLGGTCKQLQTNTNTYQLISPQCMK